MNGFKAILSVTLESTGSNVVIKNLVISILEVRQHTSNFFQALGNAELANERFTSPVKVGNTWDKQSLITNKGILSYPGELFVHQEKPSIFQVNAGPCFTGLIQLKH